MKSKHLEGRDPSQPTLQRGRRTEKNAREDKTG
jgi:hypothetical protein